MTRIILIALALALLVATASSNVVSVNPVVVDKQPRYAYDYAVNDHITKDNKAQWEARNGNLVKGSYSLIEPDGSLRVVDYKADDVSGFNAVVKRIGPNVHPSPVAAAVPLAAKPVAPIAKLPLTPVAPILQLTPVVPLPINYGFGAAPHAIGVPKVTSLGRWSLAWDPLTHSYGGWVPLKGRSRPLGPGPYATIYSKRYVNGKLVKWASGPISLAGKTLVMKKKH